MGNPNKDDWRLARMGRTSLDQPVGIRTPDQQKGINAAKRDEALKAKEHRDLTNKKDWRGLAEFNERNPGWLPRGPEEAGEKANRWEEKDHRRDAFGREILGNAPDRTAPAASARPSDVFNTRGGSNMGGAPPSGTQSQTAPASAPTAAPVERNGQPEGRREGESEFDYTERVNQARGAAEGAYGSKPQQGRPSINSQRQSFVDTIQSNKGEDGFSDKFEEQARNEGKRLGLDPEQINAALDGFEGGDLAPAKIAERAAAQKKAHGKAQPAPVKEGFANKNLEEAYNMIPRAKAMGSLEAAESLLNTDEAYAKLEEVQKEIAANKEGRAFIESENVANSVAKEKERRRVGVAQEAALEGRRNLVDNALSGDRAFTDSRIFEGNWSERQELLPPSDKIGEMSDDEIRGYVTKQINQEQKVAENFNKELGSKTKGSYESTGGTYGVTTKVRDYETDAFSVLRLNALGMSPNASFDAKPNEDIFGEMGSGPLGSLRRGAKATANGLMGLGWSAGESNMTYQLPKTLGPTMGGRENPIIKNAREKIIDAAAKSGHPIWQDKELMANPEFSKRIKADPRFAGKIPDEKLTTSIDSHDKTAKQIQRLSGSLNPFEEQAAV